MRIALAILCSVAVLFWLRFLVALLSEVRHLPRGAARLQRRGTLITMGSKVQKQKGEPPTDLRIAL
jgi:hypothetical protein